jgi:7 transmembrane receptor (rhodopsin family)
MQVTLSIICAFIGCWTPYFVVHLIHIWSEYEYYIPVSVYVFAETLALLNSALNPVLYGFFNVQLKRGLIEVCCPRRIRALQSTAGQYSGGGGPGGAQRASVVGGGSTMASTRRQRPTAGDQIVAVSTMRTSSADSEDQQPQPSVDATSRTALDHIITEQNQRGFKLRVQFVGSSDRSRCQRQRLQSTTAAAAAATTSTTTTAVGAISGVAVDGVHTETNWVTMKRLSTSVGDVSRCSWSRGDSLVSSVL